MRGKWLLWLGLALGLGATWFGLQSSADDADRWIAAARYTARIGFPLLILAYVARPLVDLTRSDWAKWLLARRKYLGLAFAMSHTVHLVVLITAIRISGIDKGMVTYVFGGLAYAVLYAMAFTSNARAMKAMGRNWKRLHRFGIHYLWFIFAQSYIGRIFQDGKVEEGAIGAAIALTAAAIRLAAWLKQRRRTGSPVAV